MCYYIFNNFSLFICLWFYIFQLTYGSLLSRLKNPYQYISSSEVVILPEDYEDEMKQLVSATDALFKLEEEPKFTKKTWHAHNEGNLWRPSKIMYRSTTKSTETLEPIAEFKAWPTIPWIYLQSRSTTELLTEPPPTQSSSASSRSWRPYFPTRSRLKLLNHKYWNIVSPSKHSHTMKLNISRSTTVYLTTVTPKRAPKLLSAEEPDYSENLTYTRGIEGMGNTGMMLRIIFNDFIVTRRRGFIKPKKTNARRSDVNSTKCYYCGMNTPINRDSDCYPIFDSSDQSLRYQMKIREKNCHDNYLDGCFKRFLDVGSQYIERDCRAHWPSLGRSGVVSERFQAVERMLEGVPVGCISSPFASLTQFHRRISLYARYHVCVCNKELCNSAACRYFHRSLFLIWIWFFAHDFYYRP